MRCLIGLCNRLCRLTPFLRQACKYAYATQSVAPYMDLRAVGGLVVIDISKDPLLGLWCPTRIPTIFSNYHRTRIVRKKCATQWWLIIPGHRFTWCRSIKKPLQPATGLGSTRKGGSRPDWAGFGPDWAGFGLNGARSRPDWAGSDITGRDPDPTGRVQT